MYKCLKLKKCIQLKIKLNKNDILILFLVPDLLCTYGYWV